MIKPVIKSELQCYLYFVPFFHQHAQEMIWVIIKLYQKLFCNEILFALIWHPEFLSSLKYVDVFQKPDFWLHIYLQSDVLISDDEKMGGRAFSLEKV